MIHLFCALKCEANPLRDEYRLQPHGDAQLFRIYTSDRQDLSLTVSGVGKLAMAAAVTYTAALLGASRRDGALNVGIAGHGDLPMASAALVNKITDAGSGKTWFPQIVFDSPLPRLPLLTVDQPAPDYPDRVLYDMEAAGFYDGASRVMTAELVQCFKIVSDNRLHPAERIDQSLVSRLVSGNLETIDAVIRQMAQLAEQACPADGMREVHDALTSRWHFTRTESLRLKQVLNRWQILLPAVSPVSLLPEKPGSGTEILARLQTALDETPLSFE